MEEMRTDGKFYEAGDMVRANCADCMGCSDCCEGMGSSIHLDPYDCYEMIRATGLSILQLLEEYIELNVVDGMILPNIKMTKEGDCCSFLKDKRCSIHNNRPGLCRLFPLGRNYEKGMLNYILLKDACSKTNRTKIKVSKWLDVKNFTDFAEYEQFVKTWHYLVKTIQTEAKTMSQERLKTVNLYVLNLFFLTPFEASEPFYLQFITRADKAVRELCLEEAYENQFK